MYAAIFRNLTAFPPTNRKLPGKYHSSHLLPLSFMTSTPRTRLRISEIRSFNKHQENKLPAGLSRMDKGILKL